MAVIEGGISTNLAEVDSNNNLKVNLPTTKTQAGYAILAGERHNGASGLSRDVVAFRPSLSGRMKVGIDTRYWQDAFNHAVVDLGTYLYQSTTMTTTLAGGYMVMNTTNSIASLATTRIQTYRSFPLIANGATIFICRLRFALAPVSNNVCEVGLGSATGTTVPAFGAYFKLTASGDLVGVVNFNASEITTSAFTAPVGNQVYEYRIVIDDDRVQYFIDDVLVGEIDTGTSNAFATYFRQLPMLFRIYNASATTSAQRIEIAEVTVNIEDFDSGRNIETIQAGQNMNAIHVLRGVAVGQSHNYANNTAPASATLSNTAAGYSFIGGQYQFAAVAGAETDYALFAYQIPALATAAGSRNFFVRGVYIETFNMGAASATTPTLLQWGIGIGSTAVSLATTDSSAGAGARAPRRIPLGVQSIPVGTPIGGSVSPINRAFEVPLMVENGTFFHVILRMPVGTATASQIIRGIVSIDGYYE